MKPVTNTSPDHLVMDFFKENIFKYRKIISFFAVLMYLILAFVVDFSYLKLINVVCVSAYMVLLAVMRWNGSIINNTLVVSQVIGALMLGAFCGELLA